MNLRRGRRRQSRPFDRLAVEAQFLRNRNQLIRLAGLMERQRRAVELTAVRPHREELNVILIIAEKKAASFVHQAPGECRGSDVLIRSGSKVLRPQGMDPTMVDASCQRYGYYRY